MKEPLEVKDFTKNWFFILAVVVLLNQLLLDYIIEDVLTNTIVSSGSAILVFILVVLGILKIKNDGKGLYII